MGWRGIRRGEWHLGIARRPLQHVSFHASFIHFITSLGRCKGVEKKPCFTEAGWEGPHSTSSSPDAAIASAGSAPARVESAAGNSGGVEVSVPRQLTGSTRGRA